MNTIRTRLFAMADQQYRDFHSKLMPTVGKTTVLGVRTPLLRRYAKQLVNDFPDLCNEFLTNLPHPYYEENNLHAFIIEQQKDFDKCICMLDSFLPYVNNWATCDCMNPKVLGKNKQLLWDIIPHWLCSDKTYTVRFGIKMLMTHFLCDEYCDASMEKVCGIRSDEYYINMMISWFFATALALQYDKAKKYLESRRLSEWCHNKAIQKARESFRVCDEHKIYLKTLTI